MNIGKMLGISPQHVILRMREEFDESSLPDIGDIVYNVNNEKIGKIADIFGPVKRPFISVKVTGKYTLQDMEQYRGRSFFTYKKRDKRKKYQSKPRNKVSGKRGRIPADGSVKKMNKKSKKTGNLSKS